MPLSEFLQKTVAVKSKAAAQLKMSNFSSGPFSFPDHELAELLWENGQIVTQEHANRPGKNFPNGHSNQSDGTTSGPKNGQPDTIDPFGNVLPNGQDDEMVPWISYPVEEPLRTDFCSDLLEEFAGGSLRLSSVHDLRNSGNVQPENASKAPAGGKPNLLFHSSQQCQSSDTTTTTRVLDVGTRDRGKSQIDPSMELANTRNQNPPSTRPARSSVDTGFVNFSLFSRPIMNARDKPPIADRMRGIDKSSALVVGNPLETKFVDPISSVKHAAAVRGQSASGMSKLDSKLSEKHLQTLIFVDHLKAATERDAPRTETNNAITIDCNVAGNMASTKDQAAKGPEATVTSSSLCSVNDAGVESSDPKGGEKRKSCEREESSSNHSEDLEDESVGAKRPTNVRRTGSKRSRAAEVHNLSERRRRERINEKMRALQELIPNCNKADKASMLEDAIEYLKSLQQQVQLLSMGGGMYMPSMMLPPGMEHMRPPHMYPFVPMGVGMGMGMGMGFGMGMYDLRGPPGCPIVPVSPMQRLQFSCPSVPPPPTLHGLVGAMNHQVFGATGMGVSPSAHGFPQFGSSSDPATGTSSAPEIPSLATVPAPSLGVAAPVSAEQKQESKNLEAV